MGAGDPCFGVQGRLKRHPCPADAGRQDSSRCLTSFRLFPISSAFPVKGFQPVTWAIIGLCGLVAVAQLALTQTVPPETVYLDYGSHPALVVFDFLPWNPDSAHIAWTALTSMFVHAGMLHVLFNMLFFHCFSEPVESLMGSVRYAIFYLLCGFAGVVMYGILNPDSFTPLVGASGAVTGVLTAHTLLLPWTRIRISLVSDSTAPAWGFTATWIGLQVLQAVSGDATTAFGAHFGGGVAGLMLAPLFVKRGVLMLAPPVEDAEHAFEYDEGFAVSWPVAAGIAGLLVAGLGSLLLGCPKDVDPVAAANAREWVAMARLEGAGLPKDTMRGLALYRTVAPEDPAIAFRLAETLHNGKTVPKDDVEAAQWYERAARAKQPDAIQAYALMLIDGAVVPRDRARGLALFVELAGEGYSSADLRLGEILEQGRGSAPPDFSAAVERYRHGCDNPATERAKTAGRAQSCRRYAQMLKEGRGVPADQDAADKLLKQLEARELMDAGIEALQQRHR